MAAYGAQLKQGKTDSRRSSTCTSSSSTSPCRTTAPATSLNTFIARQGRRAAHLRERGDPRPAGGQDVAVRDPALDDPDREPDRASRRRASTRPRRTRSCDFLHTPDAQQIFADNGYRPVVKSVAGQTARRSRRGRACSRSTTRPRRLGEGAEEVLRPEQRASWPRIEQSGRRRHWLAPRRSAAARRGRPRGDGLDGPLPRHRHELPQPHRRCCRSRRSSGRRRTPARAASGTRHEPGGGRRAQADARRVGRRRARERRHRHGDAWVLVRDDFRGKALVNALIDLPFALPTIVAGLTLLALYGPQSPIGINVAYTRAGDRARAAVRDAAVRRAHGAAGAARARPRDGGGGRVARRRPSCTTFRRIVFPNILPGDPLRRRARVRQGGRRVRLARAHLRATCRSRPRSPRSTSSAGSRAATARAPRRSPSCCSRSRSRCCSLIGAIRRCATRHDRG